MAGSTGLVVVCDQSDHVEVFEVGSTVFEVDDHAIHSPDLVVGSADREDDVVGHEPHGCSSLEVVGFPDLDELYVVVEVVLEVV